MGEERATEKVTEKAEEKAQEWVPKKYDQSDRLGGRNGEIWRLYCSGKTQEWLSKKFGIAQPTISDILRSVRESIPEDEREDWKTRALETLAEIHAVLYELGRESSTPAFHAGVVLRDEAGETILDRSGQLAAIDRLTRVSERMSRLLGLDAPVKLEGRGELKVTVSRDVDLDKLT